MKAFSTQNAGFWKKWLAQQLTKIKKREVLISTGRSKNIAKKISREDDYLTHKSNASVVIVKTTNGLLTVFPRIFFTIILEILF